MPEKTVKSIALKSFVGSGFMVREGSVIDFPERWFKDYEKRGYITRYKTRMVEPKHQPTPEPEGLVANHPHINDDTSKFEVDSLERRGPYYVMPDGSNVLGRGNAEVALRRYYAEHKSDN